MIEINLSIQAVRIGKDTKIVFIIVIVVVKVFRPQKRYSRGKQLKKLVCIGLKSRNRVLAIRIVARDMIGGYKDTERGLIEKSISKREYKQKKYYRLDAIVLMVARHSITRRRRDTYFDRSVGTLCVVTLDNILYNKNNIIRKVVTSSPI